jgi:RHS repeat-associated protein
MACACLVTPSWAEDKNGLSPDVVQLPDGPGSILGLGEDFEADLASGTAQYRFRFARPAAMGRLVPDFPLDYDSGEGNGPLGFGWLLEVPYVHRKAIKPLVRYVDGPNGVDDDFDGVIDNVREQDRFVSEIHESPTALVPDEDGYYLGTVESTFIRYERDGDAWIAIHPTGEKMFFGETENSRIFNPETGDIFWWQMNREQDAFGNEIRYEYIRFDDPANLNNIYLETVSWGPGPPPWDNFHFVRFTWEDRPDVIETGSPGFLLRTGKRLSRVEVCTQGPDLDGHAAGDRNGDGITDYLNRRYDMGYEDDYDFTRLIEIAETGADGVTSRPSLTFGYTTCIFEDVLSAADFTLDSVNVPPRLMNNDAVEITELNGDGLADILVTDAGGGLHKAYLNEGEISAGDTRAVQWSDAVEIGGDQRVYTVNFASSQLPTDLADLNGDGRSDLVVTNGPFEGYFFPHLIENQLPVWGTRQPFYVGDTLASPPSPFGNDEVARTDMNGDKRGDIVQTIASGNRTSLRIWYNLGGGRFSEPVTYPQEFTYRFSQDKVSFEDFNGDGLPDFTRITPTTIEVAPGLGYGRFAELATAAIPDGPLNQLQFEAASLEDITADGLPDLVIERAEPGTLWYWVNLSDYRLAPKRKIVDLPTPLGFDPAVRWADFNGNGTTDLVYADDLADSRLRIVDVGEILGCVPAPNLMNNINNGLGRNTVVDHTSSAVFALADAANGTPWPDPMPFAVEVVSRTTTTDFFEGEYVNEFTYHDGFYNPDFRFFAGFGAVENADLGDPAAPTQVDYYRFDVGKEFFALKGSLLEYRIEDEEGNVFQKETTEYNARLIYTGVDDYEVRFPYPTATIVEITERGQGDPVTLRTEYEYDDYGNVTALREYGIVDGDNLGVGNDERITTTSYAINEADWLVRYPHETQIRDLAGTLVAREETFYDDETFAADNPGEVTVGNETLVRGWYVPEDDEAFVEDRRAKYDSFGNVTQVLDSLAQAPGGVIDATVGHFRSMAYDDLFNYYPTLETIHLDGNAPDLEIRAAYDYGLGTVIESTDFNGNVTQYRHGPFGRLQAVIRPGDDPDYPTAEYDYVEGLSLPGGGVVSYVETRRLDQLTVDPDADKATQYYHSRDYIDGMGRLLMTRDEAGPDPDTGAPRVRVKEATEFHGRAGVQAAIQPFFTELEGDTLEDLLAFEDILADGWTGAFYVDGETVSLDLASAPKVSTVFDVPLRPVTMTQPDGAVRTTAYEPLIVRTSDENDNDPDSPFFGTPTVQYSDGLGRLVRVDEVVRLNDDGTPADDLQTWTTTYTYRPEDYLTGIVDSQGNQRSYTYNGFGELMMTSDPDRGVSTYDYDDVGNMVITTDQLGRTILFTYDGANRRRTVDYRDEAEDFSAGYDYDPDQPLSPDNRADVVYFYDIPSSDVDRGDGTTGTPDNTRGRLARVWDLSGTLHTSYDMRGRVNWSTREAIDPITGTAAPFTTYLTYDPLDRLAAVTYPDGDSATYGYNAGDKLNRIGGGAGVNAGGVDAILADARYAPSGQRLQWDLGNGLSTRYAYDNRGRITSLSTGSGLPDVDPIQDLGYGFDDVGNLTGVTDRRTTDLVPAGNLRRNTRLFSYDDVYRLTGVQHAFNDPAEDPANDASLTYRYDRIGNLLEKTATLDNTDEAGLPTANVGLYGYGGAAGASNRIGGADGESTPGPHAVTSIDDGAFDTGILYDGVGNVTDFFDLTLTWDFSNRLVRAENDQMTARYTYDHTGRRASRRVDFKDTADTLDTATKSTLYIGKHFEVRDAGQPVKYVLEGKRKIARILGTLNDDTETRTQRIRLNSGWNVVGLLVEADDLFTQFGVDTDATLEAVLLVDLNDGTTTPLAEEDELFAGSVLFVKATDPSVKTLVGTYTEPTRDTLELRPGYFSFPSWSGAHLATFFPDIIDFAWLHDGPAQTWRAYLYGERSFLSDTPAYAGPGAPFFIDLRGSITFDAPARQQEIQYYVPDHLGSTSLLVDAAGNVLEETAYLPFGEPRLRYTADDTTPAFEQTYLFNQKERDAETRLHLFDARYLSGRIGRFMSVDPAVGAVPHDALENPQMLNAYSYAANNPITLSDPSGLMPDKKDKGLLPRGNILSDRVKDQKIKISSFKSLLSNVPDEFEFIDPTDVPDAKDILKDVKEAADDLKSALDEENAELKEAGKKEIKVDVKSFSAALANADNNGIASQLNILTKFFKQEDLDELGGEDGEELRKTSC